jgi:F-type H+-transporting ATPase subunit b
MEIVSQTELVSINATMLVQVMSFLIFLVIITRIMFKPLRRTMEDRSLHIQQLQHEMVLQEKKLNEISAALAKEEKSLKAEAFLESEQRESSAKEEAQVLLRQAREEIITQQRKATEEIQGRIRAAREQLANETEPLILMIMEKILGRGVQP